MLRTITFFLLITSTLISISYAEDVSWQASPNNWDNSQYNYDNSPLNFNNSINNYENQENSPKRRNIVNTLGLTIGYVVYKKNGGANYFDNDGKRIGYTPVDTPLEQYGEIAYSSDGEETSFKIENNEGDKPTIDLEQLPPKEDESPTTEEAPQ